MRSEPVVRNCDSSGWYSTVENIVLAKKAARRVKLLAFQMMHEPSADADTISSSAFVICTLVTVPLCSFSDTSIVTRFHTRTRPSAPPDTIL